MPALASANTIDAIRAQVRAARREGKSIGFVPTMGALHAGHASLIKRAKESCDYVVVSVFVNPTQFGPGEDLEGYPRDLEADAQTIGESGGDCLFYPTKEMMYPQGFRTWVEVEELTSTLCGAKRPGHFRGVTTIVTKLFNIVAADKAFFGRKDFQQATVLQRMVRDLNLPLDLIVCPTVREADGLAMSSRNAYLSPDERKQALCLVGALDAVRRAYADGERSAAVLKERAAKVISVQPDARVDYIEIVEPDQLRSVDQASDDAVMALAVYLGKARLIDNAPLTGER